MNDFDPGSGWREVRPGEQPGAERLVWSSEGSHTPGRVWVREEPLPPTPSEPHTVILTRGKPGWDNWELKLDGDGKLWRSTKTQAVFDPDELSRYITGFEILAQPFTPGLAEQLRDTVRCETAKAVLDRVRPYIDVRDKSAYERVRTEEFGVSS